LQDQIISFGNELAAIPPDKLPVDGSSVVASEGDLGSATSADVYPANWDVASGNVKSQSAALNRRYKAVIVPDSSSAEPYSFLSVPFKPQVWKQAGPTTTTKSIIDRTKRFRRLGSQDVHILPTSTEMAEQLIVQHPTTSRYVQIQLKQFLRSICLFYQLTDEDFDSIESHSTIQTYKDGDTILSNGEVTDNIMIVLSGTVTKRCISASLNSTTVSMEYSFDLAIGDVFGVSFQDFDDASTAEFTAEGDVHILLVPLDSLLDCLTTDGIDRNLLRYSPPFNILVPNPPPEAARLYQFVEQTLDLFEAFDSQYAAQFGGNNANLKAMNQRRNTRRKSYKIHEEGDVLSTSDSDGQSLSTASLLPLSMDNVEVKRMLIFTLLSFLSPGLSTDGVGLEDILAVIEQFFSVNRARYFEIDRDRHTMLMKSVSMASNVCSFLEFPIVGVTGHVARNQCLQNIPSVKNCELFDKELDQVPGDPTEQILCVPTDCSLVQSAARVNGVLQLINSLTGQWIREREETIASLFALLLGSTMQARCSYLRELHSIPTRSMPKIRISFRLERLCVRAASAGSKSNQVKCVAKLLLSACQSATPVVTNVVPLNVQISSAASAVSSNSSVRSNLGGADAGAQNGFLYGSFDVSIEFPELFLWNLSQCSKILLEFFTTKKMTGRPTSPGGSTSASAANTALGWCIFPLFDTGNVLLAAAHRFTVTPGAFTGSIFTPNSIELRVRSVARPAYASSSATATGSSAGLATQSSAGDSEDHSRVGVDHVDLWFPVFDGHPVLYSRTATNAASTSKKRYDAWQDAKDIKWYFSRMSKQERTRTEELLGLSLCSSRVPQIGATDRNLLWTMRHALMASFTMLPYVLLSIDWTDPDAIDEGYHLMHTWQNPDIAQILQLLGPAFSDATIRAFASQKLNELEDDELCVMMPFFCRLLARYESSADNALSRQLCTRSLSNYDALGMPFLNSLIAEQSNCANATLASGNANVITPLLELTDRFAPASMRVAIGLQHQLLCQLEGCLLAYEQGLASKRAPENRIAAVEALQVALERLRFQVPGVLSLPGCSTQFTRIHPRMSGPVNDLLTTNFIIRFVNRKPGSTASIGNSPSTGAEEDDELSGTFQATDLTSVLITRQCTAEWRLEQLARQMIDVCNKCWDLSGIEPRCQVDPVITGPNNIWLRQLHPACRSLAQVSASVRATNVSDRETSSRSIRFGSGGSKDARMDRATGIEVLDGFSFGGKKYHSELLTQWLALSGSNMDSVRSAFMNNFAGTKQKVASHFLTNCKLFVFSAAYCVLNYLFGFEAQSGEQIMVSPIGEVFLKDYGPTFLGLLQRRSSETAASR
jgi:hypothetical protein